jgi:hypothetical protein
MRYLLLCMVLFSFCSCKRIKIEYPVIEDKTRPSDFDERMREICPF